MPIDEKSETEILQLVNPIMDNLMEASTRIDHARHTRDFTERLKAIVTEDYLKKVCTKYQSERGYLGERKFAALFRRPGAVAVIWKQGFTKQPGEYVAEALFVDQDGRYLVDHVFVW